MAKRTAKKTKRVYTTSDDRGVVVAVIVPGAEDRPVIKLLRQDGRNLATEFSLTDKKRGTVFPTRSTAQRAAAQHAKIHPGLSYFPLSIGQRDTNRIVVKG